MARNLDPSKVGPNTLAVHAGESPDPATGASGPNIVMSSTYVTDKPEGFSASELTPDSPYVYTRWANPTVRMLEGIGYGCRDNALTLGLNGQMWSVQEPLLAFGNEEQKQRYLPALCSGALLAAHGMTEPESGSDAYSLGTTAKRVAGGYLLNGSKCFIGLAPVAGLALVFAKTDPDAGP